MDDVSDNMDVWMEMILEMKEKSFFSEMKRVAFRPGDTVLKSQPFAFVIIASHRCSSCL